MIVLIVTCGVLTHFLQSGLATPVVVNIESVPHGVLATQPQEVEIIEAYWKVFIVIQPPDLPDHLTLEKELLALAELLERTIRRDRLMGRHMSDRWRLRIRLLQQLLDPKETTRRKRGLLNAGGWLLNKVFGTATEAEILEIKDLLNEGKAQGEAVKHQVERMTTVINEVIRAENKTRQFIQDNHAVVLKLSHRLNRLLTELNASLETAHHLQLVEMIEGYIAEIESRHAAIHFRTEEFENQRMQLERGRLAENLLSPTDLLDIIKQATQFGLQGAPVVWYYEQCLVQPVWENNEYLTFQVDLPLVKETLTQFTLRTFPTLVNKDWMQLKMHRNIGYHAETGAMSMLQACRGINPVLCAKDLTYRGGLPCERSVILQDGRDFPTCRITTVTVDGAHAEMIQPGLYVVITADSNVEVRCFEQATYRKAIQPGTNQITFPTVPCQVEGESGWVLHNTILHTSHLTRRAPILNLSHIDMPDLPPFKTLPAFRITQLKEVTGVSIEELAQMPNPILPQPHKWSNTITIVMLVICAVGGVAIYFVRKKRLWCFRVPTTPAKGQDVTEDRGSQSLVAPPEKPTDGLAAYST